MKRTTNHADRGKFITLLLLVIESPEAWKLRNQCLHQDDTGITIPEKCNRNYFKLVGQWKDYASFSPCEQRQLGIAFEGLARAHGITAARKAAYRPLPRKPSLSGTRAGEKISSKVKKGLTPVKKFVIKWWKLRSDVWNKSVDTTYAFINKHFL